MPRCIEVLHQLFEGAFDVWFNVAQAQEHRGSWCLTPEEDQPDKAMGRQFVGTAADVTAHAFAQEALNAVSGNGKARNALGNTDAVLNLFRRCMRV